VISASQVANITGLSHGHLVKGDVFKIEPFLKKERKKETTGNLKVILNIDHV
jgi:hypothetical protein